MRRALALALAAFLGGCSSVADYRPYVVDVAEPAALARDEKDCLASAEAYSAPLSVRAIANGAAQGASSNASGAAINPLVPVLGAAGGATSVLLSEIGLLNNDQRRVFLICLSHHGERSRAYNVVDPNQ